MMGILQWNFESWNAIEIECMCVCVSNPWNRYEQIYQRLFWCSVFEFWLSSCGFTQWFFIRLTIFDGITSSQPQRRVSVPLHAAQHLIKCCAVWTVHECVDMHIHSCPMIRVCFEHFEKLKKQNGPPRECWNCLCGSCTCTRHWLHCLMDNAWQHIIHECVRQSEWHSATQHAKTC